MSPGCRTEYQSYPEMENKSCPCVQDTSLLFISGMPDTLTFISIAFLFNPLQHKDMFWGRLETLLEKREHPGKQHFLLFAKCFLSYIYTHTQNNFMGNSKACLQKVLVLIYVWCWSKGHRSDVDWSEEDQQKPIALKECCCGPMCSPRNQEA